MKNLFWMITLVALILFSFACDTTESDEDSNTLGGDTNIPIVQEGNTAYTVVEFDGSYTRLDGDIKVTSSSKGIVNLHIKADLSKIPGFSNIVDFIPAKSRDADGKLNADLKFKITSEGIQDFIFNKDGKAHTLVKYNAEVGDKYSLTQSDGTTITRKVTHKSSTDDFQWGMMFIKTITVEQNSTDPGIQKYIFKANHRFGLVWFSVILEDGSVVSSYIYPANY